MILHSPSTLAKCVCLFCLLFRSISFTEIGVRMHATAQLFSQPLKYTMWGRQSNTGTEWYIGLVNY